MQVLPSEHPSAMPADPLLSPDRAAAEVGLSIPAFWKAVAAQRFPAPLYPAPRAPRWRQSELRDAVEKTRAWPSVQKLARRAARFQATAA